MKKLLLITACAAALVACSKPAEEPAPAPAPAPEAADVSSPESAAAAPANDASDAAAAAPDDGGNAPGKQPSPIRLAKPAAPPSPNLPQLAYSHHYAIEAPSRSVPLLVDKHEAACVAAGPDRCQVTGAAVHQESANAVTGTLSLRAEAGWLSGFRKGLAEDAEAVGGKIKTSGTQTEELSGAMVDTNADIAAKIALRDRLKRLVETHEGKLPDLVALERQLADVQADIDAARGHLSSMRGRVAMSQITIDYGPKVGLIEDGAWSPVGQAVRASQGLMARTIALVIAGLAAFGPLALIVLGVWFAVGRTLRRGKKPAAPAAS